MAEHWLNEQRRMVRGIERQQATIRSTIQPTGVLEQARHGVEMLLRIEREGAISVQALKQ
jgi:hypothetical protein